MWGIISSCVPRRARDPTGSSTACLFDSVRVSAENHPCEPFWCFVTASRAGSIPTSLITTALSASVGNGTRLAWGNGCGRGDCPRARSSARPPSARGVLPKRLRGAARLTVGFNSSRACTWPILRPFWMSCGVPMPKRVLVVGHNPGLEELVARLTGNDEHLPTATLAQISLPIDQWRDLLLLTEGQLVSLWRPEE